MPTLPIAVTPADGWVVLHTAASNSNISVEKVNGGSSAVLAIDTAPPTSMAGYSIPNQRLKNAVLSAGESLYVRCIDDLAENEMSVFVVTAGAVSGGGGSGGTTAIPLPGEPGSTIISTMQMIGEGAPGSLYQTIGYTHPGSAIVPACLARDYTDVTLWTQTNENPTVPVGGTWAMAGCGPYGFSVTAWTRIDTAEILRGLPKAGAESIVRNPHYVSEMTSLIDCEVYFRDAWHPFTAFSDDVTEWGKEIHARAASGDYGVITPYNPQQTGE